MIASVSSAAADKPLRPRRELRALDGFGVLGARQDLPAAADLHELDAVAVDVVVLAELVERAIAARRRDASGIERGQLVGGDRARAGEQRGFKQLR